MKTKDEKKIPTYYNIYVGIILGLQKMINFRDSGKSA